MAKPAEPAPGQPEPGHPQPLDRDEKVKLDLPFGTALRALLKTPSPKPAGPARSDAKPKPR